MFAGTRATTQPYNLNISGTTINIDYQGDNGQTAVQVSASRSLAVSDPGSKVFGTSSTMAAPPLTTNGNQLLQAISVFNQALSMGSSNPNFQTYLASALSGFDAGQQNVLTTAAQVGSRDNEASALQQLGNTQNANYTKTLSDLQGLDIPQTVSDFQQALTALQATQKTFQQVTSLSLFNYIQ
jgi:flagellar hook-associated protein 3 FlgL